MRRMAIPTLILIALITGWYRPAKAAIPGSAAVTFTHVFAPEHGLVVPLEKPFRQDICLNGLWQFEPLALPPGYKWGAGPPKLPMPTSDEWSATPIRIPSPWNVDSFASGNGGEFDCFPSYPERWNSARMGWLKTTFRIPLSWQGKDIYLHFMSVVGAARIIVNGHRLADHFNNFLPFELDVTNTIKYGRTNVLLVGVRKPNLFNIKGSFNSKYTYPTGSFWGMHVVGIDQDVFLEARPRLHVDSVFIEPMLNQDTLRIRVKISNQSNVKQSFSLTSSVRPWKWLDRGNDITAPESKSALGGVVLRVAATDELLNPGQTGTFTLQAAVHKRLKDWTLNSPQLYAMVVAIHQGTQIADRKYDRFGWRQWSIKGKDLLLNGMPVKLYADAWHFLGVPAMTPRYVWAWFTMLKAAHCNAVRLHAQPRPPFFLKMADQMGIAVLDESGIWASHCGFNYQQAVTWKRFRRALKAQVRRDRNHPSIFGWSVANEIYAAMYVVHAPPNLKATVSGKIVNLAHMVESMDPTRPWVSSDGDGDMNGRLPVFIAHYGTPRDWLYHAKLNKPFGVGECTETYYSTPPMVAKLEGDRAYKNMNDYMEGLAIQAYQDAVAERKLCAYGSLWDLVWYGLKPLPIGLPDLSRPATLHDGIFFGPFVPHQPGIQPERLGPYCTTLNPGYDPRLPMFEPWPFWRAVQAARAPGGPLPSPWEKAIPEKPLAKPRPAFIDRVAFIGDHNGSLLKQLRTLHISVVLHGLTSKLLIIDATSLHRIAIPALAASVRATTLHGGTVLVLNVNPRSLTTVNRLLPKPIILTNRRAASLMANRKSSVTAPISLAQLYFGQSHHPYIMTHGITGPLIPGATTLLWACPTNWLAWIHKPEYLKPATLIESQRETKPDGAAMIQYPNGKGKLIISTIRFKPGSLRRMKLLRQLLVDLQVATTKSDADASIRQDTWNGAFQRPLK